MTTSIRLRLIDWLGRVFDNPAKTGVEYLSGRKRHSQSGCDQHLGTVAHIPEGAPEGKMDDTVIVPTFQQNIDEFNRLAAFGDAPSFAGYNDHLAGISKARNFIVHQPSPYSENRVSLNAKPAGVES